jgi:hypothetical protein
LNTLIEYMYRDADNYKVFREEVLEGLLTEVQIEKIKSTLEEGDSFVPQQVGLQPLQEELQKYDSKNWGVDHPWHDLLEIKQTERESSILTTAEGFYELWTEAVKKGWNDTFKVGHILNRK